MRALLALALLCLPGAPWAACPVGQVGPLEVIGPLLDADPRQAPSTDAPGPGRRGDVAWRPADGTCGVMTLGMEPGRYLVRGLVALPAAPVVALHVRAQGAARVFWGGALIGAVADGESVFGVPGGGAQPLVVEVRATYVARLTLAWSTLDGRGLAVRLASEAAPGAARPTTPVLLPRPWPPGHGPMHWPPTPPPELPPPDDLPPFERGGPAPPGVDLELLADAWQVNLDAGAYRRQVRLRPLTLVGVRTLRRLTLPGFAHLTVEGVVHGLEGPLPVTGTGPGGSLALPPVAVGDAVDLTWYGKDAPEVGRSAALPTARWSLTVDVGRARPLETVAVGAVGPEIDDRRPGRRRLRWVGRGVAPGGASVRLGPARDPEGWRDAFLAAHGDQLWGTRWDEARPDAREVAARTPTFRDPWERAAWATRSLRKAGLAAVPIFVRATPLPPGPTRLADFDDVVVWVPGEPPPPGAVRLPATWGAPLEAGPAAGPTRALTCRPSPPASLLDPPGAPVPAVQWFEQAGPATEISKEFATFRRDGAGRAQLAVRRPADARALARFCRQVAR